MADLVMRKRPAMHAGEMGLFIDAEAFEDDFSHIKSGIDINVAATHGRNPKQDRLAWALADKIAKSGTLGDGDKRDVMNWLLMRCKHVRYITNRHRDGIETTPVVKSIRWSALDGPDFTRIFNRMIYIVVSLVLPDMPEGELRSEVERMAGVDTPEPEVKAAPKRRRRTAEEIAIVTEPKQRNSLPASVSVIPPDHNLVTGEVTEPPADAAPPAPTASAEPAPSVSPAAQVHGAGPVPGKPPTTVQGWKEWCKAWLEELYGDASKTDVDVLTRWSGETKLRNACGITAEERAQLFAYMNSIVEAKREAQKPI